MCLNDQSIYFNFLSCLVFSLHYYCNLVTICKSYGDLRISVYSGMRNKTIPCVIVLCFLFACSRKTAPEIPARTGTTRSIDVSATLTGDAERGKQLFGASCKRCHGLPEAGQFSKSRWEAVLPSMVQKAKLEPQEAADVKEYVMTRLIK